METQIDGLNTQQETPVGPYTLGMFIAQDQTNI